MAFSTNPHSDTKPLLERYHFLRSIYKHHCNVEDEEPMVKQLYAYHEGESSQSDSCYYEAEGLIGDTIKPQVAVENGRKRRPLQINENLEKAKEKNGVEIKIVPRDSIKPLGFRQIGSRRKNKPQRAAEVGVECK